MNCVKRRAVLAGVALCAISTAFANPVLNQVETGNVTVSQSPNSTQIQQTSQRAIINWNSFNIGANQSVNFQQPSGGVALNRINPNQGPSQIYGNLSATGQIILINQAGIYFGPNSHVDVGGIIASTSDISDANFMTGNYIFDQPSSYANSSIVNQGRIIARNYGLVALLGNQVINNGYISARLGQVVLASGSQFTLSFDQNQLINFTINAPATSSGGIVNTGKLVADGGEILVTAQAAKNVLDNVIDMQGVAEANSVGENNGEIILSGGNEGTVTVSGKLIAQGNTPGSTGGTIKVLGTDAHITLTAAIDVSGDAGGGQIDIGGDEHGRGPDPNATITTIDSGAQLAANAIIFGNGGDIIVWSDNNTQFHGNISAIGGDISGNGGFVETSGGYLDVTGAIVNVSVSNDIRAPPGITGTWLLDPTSITIESNGGSNSNLTQTGVIYAPTNGTQASSVLDVGLLESALSTSNVVVTTTPDSGTGGGGKGDIIIANSTPITWNSSNSLTLSAYRNISVGTNSPISNSGSGAIYLIADNTGKGTGTVSFGSGSYAQSGSTVMIFYNPSGDAFNNPTSSFYSGGTTPIAYMLIQGLGTSSDTASTDTLAALSNSSSLWPENFALASNIDASATSTWNSGAGFNPIGNGNTSFSGNFNGNGYVINNLTINNSSSEYTGFFGYVYNQNTANTIQNLGLTNVNITSSYTSYPFVGGLVGEAYYNVNIQNVFVTGSVTESVNATGTSVGGIVGYFDYGTISGAYSGANVSANDSSTEGRGVGGILGFDAANVTISNSYSTGNVSGDSGDTVGGLIGDIPSNVEINLLDSYSSSKVTGSGTLGALIGTGPSSDTYATYTEDFYDNSITSLPGVGFSGYSTGITGESTAYLMTPSNFTSIWNVATSSSSTPNSAVWFMVPNGSTSNQGYTRPLLISEEFLNNAPDDINTGHQLQLMDADLSANYVLGTNVNLSSGLTSLSDVWATNQNTPSGSGFSPIGLASPFTGSLNGESDTISNFYSTVDGLFAQIGSSGSEAEVIQDISLTSATLNVGSGSNSLGLLAGTNWGQISNTYIITSTITSSSGSQAVGGLVGNNEGMIATSYTASDVSITSATTNAVGGFVGINNGTIANTYALDSVTGSGSGVDVGGFAGESVSAINTSYSTGLVSETNTSHVSGFIGLNSGSMTSDYWDTDTSNQSTGVGPNSTVTSGVTGGCFTGTCTNHGTVNLSVMSSAYSGWSIAYPAGYDGTTPLNYTWMIFINYTRPMLEMEWSTLVSTPHQLQLVAAAIGANYTLANNVNLSSGMTNAADIWGTNKNTSTGSGFDPIATVSVSFSGNFNGEGYTISNYYSTTNGLFDYTTSGSISNLGLVSPTIIVNTNYQNTNIIGGFDANNFSSTLNNDYITGLSLTTNHGNFTIVGGFIGYEGGGTGTLENSYVTGTVTNTDSDVTNLSLFIGINGTGTVQNDYAIGTINNTLSSGSGMYIGLVVGNNQSAGVSNIYGIGSINNTDVNGSEDIGGLVGYNYYGVTNSFAIINITNNDTGSGASETIGGLYGFEYGDNAANEYAQGTITNNTPNAGGMNIGGLIGIDQGGIQYSYAAVYIVNTSGSANNIGVISGSDAYSENYSTDIVDADFAGTTAQQNSTTNYGCFSGSCTNGSGSLNMSSQTTFQTTLGWNFSTTWAIVNGDSYPYLQAFYSSTPRAISGTVTGYTSTDKVQLAVGATTLTTSASNGVITQGTAAIGANGFYYFLEGNNVVPNSTSITASTTVSSLSNTETSPAAGASILAFNLPAPPFIFSGTVPTGTNTGSTIDLVFDGSQIGSTTSDSSDDFSLSVSQPAIQDEGQYLLYLSGANLVGNLLFTEPSNKESLSGLNILSSTVSINAADSTAITNTSLKTAVGGISSSDILFSTTSNGSGYNLTLGNGSHTSVNFTTITGTTYQLNGSITNSSNGSNITFNGPLVLATNATVTGVVTIADGVSGNYNLTLTGSSSPQTFSLAGSLSVDNILVQGNSGADTLQITTSDPNLTWNLNGGTNTLQGITELTGYFTFTNIQNITGLGAHNDKFVQTGNASVGTLTGTSTGTNTLDYSNYATVVSIILTSANSGYTNNNSGVQITAFSNIGDVIGNTPAPAPQPATTPSVSQASVTYNAIVAAVTFPTPVGGTSSSTTTSASNSTSPITNTTSVPIVTAVGDNINQIVQDAANSDIQQASDQKIYANCS